MKTASVSELRRALKDKSRDELFVYCLALARFKLESKELLTYLVFESENEEAYIESVKQYITSTLLEINRDSYFYMKKSIRKILSQTKRFIRYSKKKETEAAVLLHFCIELNDMSPSIFRNTVLTNTYNKQLEMAAKAISKLHEDLQYDYNLILEDLQS